MSSQNNTKHPPDLQGVYFTVFVPITKWKNGEYFEYDTRKSDDILSQPYGNTHYSTSKVACGGGHSEESESFDSFPPSKREVVTSQEVALDGLLSYTIPPQRKPKSPLTLEELLRYACHTHSHFELPAYLLKKRSGNNGGEHTEGRIIRYFSKKFGLYMDGPIPSVNDIMNVFYNILYSYNTEDFSNHDLTDITEFVERQYFHIIIEYTHPRICAQECLPPLEILARLVANYDFTEFLGDDYISPEDMACHFFFISLAHHLSGTYH
jgi:hypothetical protein